MKVGDKIIVIQMEDDYYGRGGIVVEISRVLAKIKFNDEALRYYNKMNEVDIKTA